ncbi:MAG: winged helix-turn-helix domain-containing protein [Pirellulales bacterium]
MPTFPESKVEAGAVATRRTAQAGFDSQLWTLPRVALLIEREFGVSYHSTHVGRLLHALGFSCQKPKRRSREQDPEAVKTWRAEMAGDKKGGR